jgi:hypothetical protein
MRKQFTFLILIIISGLAPIHFSRATSVASIVKGKILIQVESKGEAWYVEPKTGNRYYMANGDAAYSIMRNFGVGITNMDLEKIKSDKILAKKHSGKIFLQVESRGEAYYVDFSGNLYYLKDGSAAYAAMKKLGLGITNKNLEQIPSKQLESSATKDISKIIYSKETIQEPVVAEPVKVPNRAPNQDWLDEQAEYEKYYPIIISMTDSKNNINKKSTFNTFDGDNQNKNTLTELKVGDSIALTINAKDPENRPLLYAWASNLKCFGVFSLSESPKTSDYTASNTITCPVTESLDIIRIEGYIKSEKIGYRNPSGFDDSISMNYNNLPYTPYLP